MTLTDEPRTGGGELADELLTWLEENWDPELTVGAWWERLGMAGWSNPLLPVESYGRALTRGDSLRVARMIAEHGALGAPNGLGLMLAAPTIATHGTREQIDRYVPAIVTGREAWCQLFSEPGAGSDLAGLTTRAVADGELWHVDGQKVWTSGGQIADRGMLLARTNPEAPKHQGITWFALDLHQPGVEVRPLREMTGDAMFNEVFLTDAVVADDARIGDANQGWGVANTTLSWERSGMGAGGGGRPAPGAKVAHPGTIAGCLDRPAGEFAPQPRKGAPKPASRPSSAEAGGISPTARPYVELARTLGRNTDPVLRQRLARLETLGQLTRLNTERHKAVRAAGGDIPGIANFSKLMMADIVRLCRDLGLELLGARGMLHPYTSEQRAAFVSDLPAGMAMALTSQALSAQALPIYGGTDQIQHNVLGERTLGLPKEPGDQARLPFSRLPKNG